MSEEENVIEIPEEYIIWLNRQRDFAAVCAFAISDFVDLLNEANVPDGLQPAIIKEYGRTLIRREMGTHQG